VWPVVPKPHPGLSSQAKAVPLDSKRVPIAKTMRTILLIMLPPLGLDRRYFRHVSKFGLRGAVPAAARRRFRPAGGPCTRNDWGTRMRGSAWTSTRTPSQGSTKRPPGPWKLRARRRPSPTKYFGQSP